LSGLVIVILGMPAAAMLLMDQPPSLLPAVPIQYGTIHYVFARDINLNVFNFKPVAVNLGLQSFVARRESHLMPNLMSNLISNLILIIKLGGV
jgi:hypothetical protein